MAGGGRNEPPRPAAAERPTRGGARPLKVGRRLAWGVVWVLGGGEVSRRGGRDGRDDLPLHPLGAGPEGRCVAHRSFHGEEVDVLDTQEVEDEAQVRLDEVGRGERAAVEVAGGAEGTDDVDAATGDQTGEAGAVVGEGVANAHDVVDPSLTGVG